MLSLDYDKKFDILYIVLSKDKNSYGDEVTIPGVITLRDLFSDEITGFTIMGYKKKLSEGQLDPEKFPVRLNFEKDIFPYVH
jgi:hypothetical protein